MTGNACIASSTSSRTQCCSERANRSVLIEISIVNPINDTWLRICELPFEYLCTIPYIRFIDFTFAKTKTVVDWFTCIEVDNHILLWINVMKCRLIVRIQSTDGPNHIRFLIQSKLFVTIIGCELKRMKNSVDHFSKCSYLHEISVRRYVIVLIPFSRVCVWIWKLSKPPTTSSRQTPLFWPSTWTHWNVEI